MEARSPTAVLICGAGVAGLTLAIDLARRGIPFRLIEKNGRPFPGSRGKGVQPRTQEVFEDLGIIDQVVAAGGVYPLVRHYHPDGTFTEVHPAEPAQPTPAEPYQTALMVPQFLTERIMRKRLAELGHQVEFGCELIGAEISATGIVARLAGPKGDEVVRSAYLIGSDGGHSFVRGLLGVGFSGKTLGLRAMVADVALTGLGRDAWHQFNARDMQRVMAICPLSGTDFFQVHATLENDVEIDLTPAGLARLIAERTGRRDIEVHAVTWASTYSVSARLADRYRVGRAFLVGDAAHVHPPTGGQGLNTSIQDAYNLGWKLSAVLGGAPDRLLDTYQEERRPVAEDMLALSTGLLQAAKQGDLKRGREVRQLGIGYTSSSLALKPARQTGPVRAGNRAPDAPLRGAAGCSRRLFELFTGPHWTLIGFESEREIASPRNGLRIHHVGAGRELEDDGHHFSDAYGLLPGEWLLVRPDGYVAAIVDERHTAELASLFEVAGLRANSASQS